MNRNELENSPIGELPPISEWVPPGEEFSHGTEAEYARFCFNQAEAKAAKYASRLDALRDMAQKNPHAYGRQYAWAWQTRPNAVWYRIGELHKVDKHLAYLTFLLP